MRVNGFTTTKHRGSLKVVMKKYLNQFDFQFSKPTLVTLNVATAAAHLVVRQKIVSVEIVLFSLLNGARRFEPTTKKQQDVSDD